MVGEISILIATNVCNLLLYKNHFVWIKDLGKLLNNDKTNGKKYWCSQCLSCGFDSNEKLNRHLEACMKHEAVSTKYPKKFDLEKYNSLTDEDEKKKMMNNRDDIMKFNNHQHTFKHPYFMTLDFESTLEKVDDINDTSTKKYQKHIVNSCGMKFNCIHDQHSKDVKIINNSNPENVMKETIEYLEEQAIYAYNLSKINENNIIMTDTQKIEHKLNKNCSYCNCKYTIENNKCRHHDHISGNFINSACNECNFKFTNQRFMPVYVHNLKGYDAHFLVPALNNFGYKSEDYDLITAIPNTEEKYISFSKKIKVDETRKGKDLLFEIRFIDSFAFMASSLSSLSDNLNEFKGKEFENINELRLIYRNTSNHFKNDKQFLEMIKKGVYPYDYINNYSKLSELKLPSIEHFYSRLNNTQCSQKDYNQAQKVFKLFNCKSILDYHNIYLISDVLLLTDVWENFKGTCYKIYGLDASYYYTAPSLSWSSFMKHTTEEYKNNNKNFQIELITDPDMYLMWESSIRGGLSQISKRYAKANTKSCFDYDKNESESSIRYYDAINLYGYGMSVYLPIGNFEWNNEIWNKEKIMNLDNEGKKGYLFKVDLHYPEELHDLHNGYALGCENSTIKKEWLSMEQQKDYKESNIKKLITSFNDKKDYIVNYRILKLFLSLGLELVNVKEVLQFNQEPYMRSYIMKNTNERAKAKNNFEKDFYKLMNNSVYGKTMENVRNRISFKLISSELKALRLRNTLKKFTIFNENLVGVHLCKKEVTLNKPIFIGSAVLDQSKYLMYDFHYNEMLPYFGKENLDLLFTDTDSLCYHIKNKCPDEFMKIKKDLFDLSNYNKDHKLYDKTNNKVVGKFKNEEAETEIIEFVGLRSKCYSYTTLDNQEHSKCKGVKRYIIQSKDRTDEMKYINHMNYRDCLFNKEVKKVKQNLIRSVKHQIYTMENIKIGLSSSDDKSYILPNNIDCLTLGHKNISNSN